MAPADSEEVHNAAAEAVPEAVFGDAGDAGTVVHGNFNDTRAGGMGEHGHEAVKAVKGKEGFEDGALEGAQPAAGIAEIHAEHEFAGLAGDVGGETAQGIVLAFGPHAANDVVFFQFGEEARKISGVVLQVAIESEDDRGAGIAEASPEGGALAGVAAMAQAADAGIGFGGGGDAFPGGVGAGVVHEDKLERAGLIFEGGEHLIRERGDVVGLVEHGDNDGDFRLHESGGLNNKGTKKQGRFRHGGGESFKFLQEMTEEF